MMIQTLTRTTVRFTIILILGLWGLSATESLPEPVFLKEGWMLKSSFLVPEGGETVSSAGYEAQGWFPVRLPSTVLTALVRCGVYPDPYVGMNNMLIPDACDEFNKRYGLGRFTYLPGGRNPWSDPYWYWTRFRLPEEFADRIVWLNLEGINYRAEVWLNGRRVAGSDEVVGMFRGWRFDVSDKMDRDGPNTMAVKIFPLDYPGLPAEPQLQAFGPFGLNGGPSGDIGKNVTMQSSVGWDWIPAVRDRNMGIWQDVYLSATGPIDVRNPQLVSELPLPGLDEAELNVSAELVNLTESPRSGRVAVRIRPKNFSGAGLAWERDVSLEPRETIVLRFGPESVPGLEVRHPQLWWPNGMGPQNLYELEIGADFGGPSDIERTVFGIREVESRAVTVDGWVRRDFFVNGRKVPIRGGAWVPDMMLNRGPGKTFRELRLSREANLNMVRIWGGGVTPEEEFFDGCDEMGLLVWHDFWITGDCQGTWDKGSQDYPYDAGVFLAAASDVVLRLRNHPCLLVWTAGNEGYPRREIYVPLRDEILARLDGTRPFIPSSGYRPPPLEWGLSWPDGQPAGTYSGGPYHWVDPRHYGRLVDGGQDWLFKNEVGLPSLPPLETLRRFIPDLAAVPEVKFPLNHTWGYHDACEGNGKYSLYDQAIRTRYGEPSDLADYLNKGQLINAESWRAVFEAVNRAPERTAGVILWKTNPAWPSVIWQLYDWYLRPHAGYYFVKKACRPVHVQLDLENLVIGVVNNSFEAVSGLTVSAVLYAPDGRIIGKESAPADVAAGTFKETFVLDLRHKAASGLCFLELKLLDGAKLVSDNFYWLAEGDDFGALSSLPPVRLEVESRIEDKAGRVVCTLNITNPSSHLAFFVNPSIRAGSDGEEVLPCYWSDNYFSLPPGAGEELSVEFDRENLGGNEAYLRLEGWNVPPRSVKLD